MKILVTGGLGYIGSHTSVELLNQNHEISIIDDLSNSSDEILKNIKLITKKNIDYYNINICDRKNIDELFASNKFDAVIHFAGLKSVKESEEKPEKYSKVNINGTENLLNAFSKFNKKIKTFIFSSSACIYGDEAKLPLSEDSIISPKSIYGKTKLEAEKLLLHRTKEDVSWKALSLRYFNPLGSHKSLLIGENPKSYPENLMPYIMEVGTGKFPFLKIFGNDYKTEDGTAIRDFIHVEDLAQGHIKGLNFLLKQDGSFYECINLGTGKGYSVLDVVKAFEVVNEIKIPYKFYPRRLGDVEACYADISKAKKLLNWIPMENLDEMCKSSWNFKQNRKK